jgi:hypothetical protein
MNARTAIGDVDKYVFGEGIVFLLQGPESIEEKVIGLLLYLVKVLVLLSFRHAHQLFRVEFERNQVVVIGRG